MKYKIELNKKAQKFIKSQPRNQQERILKAVSKLPDGDVKACQETATLTVCVSAIIVLSMKSITIFFL